jgi:transposase-like protein
MSSRPRRNHTLTFKAKVVLTVIKSEKTLSELAPLFDAHPNQITKWKAQLQKGPAEVFGSGGSTRPVTPTGDVKSLHAKIGELTLENIFLKERKAGLLSAKQ